MGVCSVYGCNTNNKNVKKRGLHLFHFPKDKKLSMQWLNLCKREDKIHVNNTFICSLHFSDNDFNNLMEHQLMGRKLYLKPNAVPSKNLPSNKCIDNGILEQNITCSERATKRQKINKTVQIQNVETNPKDSTILGNNELQDVEIYSVPVKSSREQELEKKIQHLLKEKQHLKKENEHFIKQKQHLIKENQYLRKENEQLHQQLHSIFTPGQIKRFLKPNKLTHWEYEDIAAAITLKSTSLKCYKFLREIRKFPLPSVSTLNYWTKRIEFEPGILTCVLDLMTEIGAC